MSSCDSRLAAGFLRNCEYKKSKAGIKAKWYGNLEDLDKSATQFTAGSSGLCISTLVLKADKKLYRVEGDKKLSSASYALSITDFGNGYIHTDKYKLMYQSWAHLKAIQALVDGARLFSIVEKVDSGLNGEIAFSVLGYESGMQITEHTGSTEENAGASLFTVATQEGEEESTPPRLFLAETYDKTLQWITDNEFKAAWPGAAGIHPPCRRNGFDEPQRSARGSLPAARPSAVSNTLGSSLQRLPRQNTRLHPRP